MNKAPQFIILCEDLLQQVFVRRFLVQYGAEGRKIHTCPIPCGKGSGEQYVRDQYPDQLKAFRTRNAKAKTALIVVMDADTQTVQKHQNELDTSAKNKEILTRGDQERIVHLIPKRNIETWLAYLDGKEINESTNYKQNINYTGKESDCHRFVDRLVEKCKKKETLPRPPESLQEACREFDRIRDSF